MMAAASQPVTAPPANTGGSQPGSVRKLPRNIEVWVVTIALIVVASYAAAKIRDGESWVLVAGAMLVFFLFLGRWICHRPLGILVSELNVMSLSRFQVVTWTLVILSAYVTIVIKRVFAGMPDALNLPMDWHLWALMGISTASLIGSPLLLESKKAANPAPAAIQRTAQALNEDQKAIEANRQGNLYSNLTPADARLTDIFQGDEIANTAYIDVAKLQMFVFTLVIAGSYAYQVYHVMYFPVEKMAFPPVSDGLVALLAISHAGYLGGKAVDYTPPRT